MDITEKYNLNRYLISDGDLILFRGIKVVSKIIQWCDKSYYNHIGVVVKVHGALFIVDANRKGVQADRLSYRVNEYKNGGDFLIIKPLKSIEEINEQMAILLKRSDNKTINYDFNNGIKELFNRKFKSKFKINKSEDDICSEFMPLYAINLEIVNEEFLKLRLTFPEDYVRFVNNKNVKLIT